MVTSRGAMMAALQQERAELLAVFIRIKCQDDQDIPDR